MLNSPELNEAEAEVAINLLEIAAEEGKKITERIHSNVESLTENENE